MTDKLSELESLHRIQVENGRHYYWNAGNMENAQYWQAQADKTKAEILLYKEQYNINTPNWWE